MAVEGCFAQVVLGLARQVITHAGNSKMFKQLKNMEEELKQVGNKVSKLQQHMMVEVRDAVKTSKRNVEAAVREAVDSLSEYQETRKLEESLVEAGYDGSTAAAHYVVIMHNILVKCSSMNCLVVKVLSPLRDDNNNEVGVYTRGAFSMDASEDLSRVFRRMVRMYVDIAAASTLNDERVVICEVTMSSDSFDPNNEYVIWLWRHVCALMMCDLFASSGKLVTDAGRQSSGITDLDCLKDPNGRDCVVIVDRHDPEPVLISERTDIKFLIADEDNLEASREADLAGQVYVVGKTGAGKSTVVNFLAAAGFPQTQVAIDVTGTLDIKEVPSSAFRRLGSKSDVILYDTPGMNDEFQLDNHYELLLTSLLRSRKTVNKIIIVVPAERGRFEHSERATIAKYANVFGREMSSRIILLLVTEKEPQVYGMVRERIVNAVNSIWACRLNDNQIYHLVLSEIRENQPQSHGYIACVEGSVSKREGERLSSSIATSTPAVCEVARKEFARIRQVFREHVTIHSSEQAKLLLEQSVSTLQTLIADCHKLTRLVTSRCDEQSITIAGQDAVWGGALVSMAAMAMSKSLCYHEYTFVLPEDDLRQEIGNLCYSFSHVNPLVLILHGVATKDLVVVEGPVRVGIKKNRRLLLRTFLVATFDAMGQAIVVSGIKNWMDGAERIND